MHISEWVHHYLWTDVYGPIWPNIAASAILGAWALRRFVRLEKIHKLHAQKLEDIHDAIRNQAVGGQL